MTSMQRTYHTITKVFPDNCRATANLDGYDIILWNNGLQSQEVKDWSYRRYSKCSSRSINNRSIKKIKQAKHTGTKLHMVDTLPGVTIEQAKVKNPNQSLPITCKVKMSAGGTKLKK